jgi:hypothetical protein
MAEFWRVLLRLQRLILIARQSILQAVYIASESISITKSGALSKNPIGKSSNPCSRSLGKERNIGRSLVAILHLEGGAGIQQRAQLLSCYHRQ